MKSDTANRIRRTLSPVQQGMYFHYVHNRNKDYQEQMICEIAGKVDVALFEKVLRLLVEKYDSLRTLFFYTHTGEMYQEVLEDKPVTLLLIDFSAMEDAAGRVERDIKKEADLNFDLARETCRSRLYKLAEGKYIFLCTYHHLIMDSWTIQLFLDDFCSMYLQLLQGGTPPIAPRYSYSLYLDWIAGQDQQKARDYWHRYLDNVSIPVLSEEEALHNVQQRRTMRVEIPAGDVAVVRQIAKACNTTVNATVLAIWGMFTLDFFHKDQLLLGCVTAGRMIGLKNINKVAGLFVNAVPVIINNTVTAACLGVQLQKDVLMASPYAYPLLSEILACGKLRPGHITCFVNFSIDATALVSEDARKLPFAVKDIRYNEQANYDLYLDVFQQEDDWHIQIYFDEDRYFFDAGLIGTKLSQIIRQYHQTPDITVKELLNVISVQGSEIGAQALFNF